MEYRLEELCNITSSKRIYRDEYVNDGIPFYRGKEIIEKANGKNISNELFITEEKYNEISNKFGVPKKGDILITGVGTVGISYLVGNETFYFKDGNLIWLKEFSSKINNQFLNIYLKTKNFKNNIEQIAIGSTQKAITIAELKKIKVNIPIIEIQNKIVKIYDSINKKIELNNQINDNLQKIGFELLSEEMEQNPVNELRNIIKFNKGKKPLDISEKYKEKYLPYLTIANLNNQEYLYASCEQVLIAKNDLLMVMDGASSGDVYYSDNGIVGSTLAKIEILDDRYNQATIYFILKYYSNYIKSKNTGSAIPHTDKEIVYKLLVPNIEKQEIYKIILDNILKLNNQNKILEQLRDTLLPKLMNGEIDLDKVEI